MYRNDMIYPSNFEEKIAFTQIRALLLKHCVSRVGGELVERMQFMTSFEAIHEQLQRVREMTQLLEREPNFPTDAYFDLREAFRRIRIEGTYLHEEEAFHLLLALQTLAQMVRLLTLHVEEGAPESGFRYPHLAKMATMAEPFPHIVKELQRLFDSAGRLKDSASPKLAEIRRELAGMSGRISRLLSRIMQSAQEAGVVDKDTQPTLRDGRLMIPVSPAMKRKIKGIVHDESASGKTFFIEPTEVVEANNRIRELEADEKHEIVRILTELADYLRPDLPRLSTSFELLGEADFVRAKVKLAEALQAICPTLEDRPLIDWIRATHPLLQLRYRAQGKQAVPLDITLTTPQRILIISGPNAGGKSVCLKTVGLLQYMLQCGLPIPLSERSRAGLFEHIFIDMGDEQSIENDLSTYSSHLNNMKVMIKRSNERSLLLIDEMGTGTEPLIGGAIAEAVLHRFHQNGTFAVITTHYQNLKHFADGHEGVVNGAMLYDRGEMRPLFELQIGQPGSSFAIEIARKIGLPTEVIDEASDIVGSDYIHADKFLQDIVRDKRYWESKRQSIRKQEKKVDELIGQYERQLHELHAGKKEILLKAQDEAKQMIEAANSRIERTIRTIKETQAEKEETKKARRALSRFKEEVVDKPTEPNPDIDRKMAQLLARKQRKEQRKKEQSLTDHTATPAPPKPRALQPGDKVKMKGQQAVGEISSIDGNQAIVVFGMIKSKVSLDRLQRTDSPSGNDKAAQSTSVSTQTQDNVYERKLAFKQELDVRGMRGDEALQAVTYYIDDAILLGADRVRILHGTGSGILRTLIRDYLHTVPSVARFADEDVRLGGAGITVVDFD